MEIKIAIFDDKIEITSPGKLPPSIDFNDMLSGQSSVRNKILAPVFKRNVEDLSSPQSKSKTVEETVEEIISCIRANPKITVKELQI